MDKDPKVSNAFMSFARDASEYHKVWMEAVMKLSSVSKLDKKTAALSYLSVLAVLRLESGIPFHVKHAKQLGATRDEIIGAVLVGLPAAGNIVTQAIPAAVQAYDENN